MDKYTLYDLAYAFRAAKPWKRIYEQEPFALTLPDGQIGYCCIMGRNGEHRALSLYIGATGFSSLRRLHDMATERTDMLFMDCVQCSIEKRELLREEELDDLRAYCKARGIPFGPTFPQFTRYAPHCVPWPIARTSDWEALEAALTVVIKMCEVLKTSPKEKLGLHDIIITKAGEEYVPTLLSPLEDDGPVTIPLYSIENGDLRISRIELPPYVETAPTPPASFNDLAIRRLKKLRRSGILECEVIRSPNLVQDNPPYLPALLFAVDHTNGLVVHHDMVEGVEYNPDEMLEDFVFGLTASKVYPERIMVRTEETIALLKEFCRRASIRLVKSERLDLLDEAVTTMKDWAENDSTDEIDQMMDALRQMSVDQIRMLPDFILMDLQKMSELLPKDIQDKIRKALG